MSKAGFEAPEVTITVVGMLVSRDGGRFLEPGDSAFSYLLSGDGEASETLRREDLIGQRLRLTGHLLASRGNGSPSLAVTAWEAEGVVEAD